MRKLIYLIVLSILILPSRVLALGPFCIAMDGCPMMDFVDEASAIMKSITGVANSAQTLIKQVTDDANSLKTFIDGVTQGEMPSAGISANNPGQRTMQNCQFKGVEYDNMDADDVAELVTMMFLEKPKTQHDIYMQQRYREQFFYETILEISSAITAIEEDLHGLTGEKIEKALEVLESGEGSGSGSDGNKNAIDTEGDAIKTVTHLYELLLKVSALRAQFAATVAIKNTEPIEYVDEEETSDTQAFLDVPQIYISSEIKNSEPMAFAKIEAATGDVADALSAIESSTKISDDSQDYVDALIFTVAPDSPNTHGYIKAEEKMEQLNAIAPLVDDVSRARSVHNLITRLENYEAIAKAVEEMRERHQKSIDKVKLADKCARSYIGRHFSNVNEVWGNNGENVTNYDSRKGISGWAWQAYETAKAAETTETSTDDIQAIDIDTPQEGIISDEVDMDATEEMLNNKSSSVSNKSQNEKGLEETRRSNMISWQIGSEASKMLASSPSKWGKGAKYPAFDVWQDVKFFYQSYINKKYNNIISYLNRFSKYDVLKIVADVLEKKADPANISLSDVDELNGTLGKELQEETSKYNSNATNSRAQNNPAIKSLLAKKTALMKELEVVSSQLKEDLDTLTDLREQVQTAAGEEMKAAATYVEPYPSDINDGITGSGKIAKIQSVSDQMDSFVSKSAESEEKLGIKEQENKVEEGKNKQANLEKKLSDLEEEISSMTLDIQESDDDLILQLTAKKTGLKDVVANILSKRQNDDKDIKKRINALVDKEIKKLKKDGMIIIGGTNEYLKLVNKANQQLSNAINQMTAIVNSAKANILALGDGLYDPANHQKVVDIHQNMINSIKAISITIDGGVLPPVRGIMLFSSLLNTDTSAEEDDYFVGNPVKKRDIKAPKMVFKESNPPLREVFYFDLTDFMNVKPFSKRNKRSSKINVQDFLNSGSEIPTVWKYLLRNPVFVEEDLDLRGLFNGNCQDISFYRHGSMPCKVRGSSQIADINVEINELLKTVSVKYNIKPKKAYPNQTFSECSTLYAKNNDVYSTYREIDVSRELIPSDLPTNCVGSELGTLLTMDAKGNILFRESVYDAFYEIWDEKEKGKELSKAKKRKMAAIDPTPFNRNQIGEFLKYAEAEQKIRQQLKELEKKYDESKEELFSMLRQFGFEPSPNLNMANSKDSNLVRTKLKQIKNKNIALATKKMKEIDIAENPVVEERVREQQSIIDAMHLDKNELIAIGEGTDDHNDLEEKIKTAKANKNVTSAYKDKMNKSVDETKNLDNPYCSIY